MMQMTANPWHPLEAYLNSLGLTVEDCGASPNSFFSCLVTWLQRQRSVGVDSRTLRSQFAYELADKWSAYVHADGEALLLQTAAKTKEQYIAAVRVDLVAGEVELEIACRLLNVDIQLWQYPLGTSRHFPTGAASNRGAPLVLAFVANHFKLCVDHSKSTVPLSPTSSTLSEQEIASQLQLLSPALLTQLARHLRITGEPAALVQVLSELIAPGFSEVEVPASPTSPFNGTQRGKGYYSYFLGGAPLLPEVDIVLKYTEHFRKLGNDPNNPTLVDSLVSQAHAFAAHSEVTEFMIGKASSPREKDLHSGMMNRFGNKYRPAGFSCMVCLYLIDGNLHASAEQHTLQLESLLRQKLGGHSKLSRVSNMQSGKVVEDPSSKYFVL
jgi:hypothetical protein